MKQYLLLLKSSDFSKSNNIWTSNPINLYSNSQFKNYSYSRSAYGLNLLGDRTYVGTELTSPSYTGTHATPYSSNVVYKTDVGEIIYEPATPTLKRFVDTTSRIDILTYRHTFTNLPGVTVPTFNITFYEADSSAGPWLRSSVSSDSNIVFIKNAKPFVKIELEIFTEDVDLSAVGLLFYLEIGIYEPVSPVISSSVRNILKRFPSWTAIFEDSVEPATPSLAIPESVGGKFMTAILQESLDNFQSDVELNSIDSYIASADESMTAWMFVSYNVPQNINILFGDSIQLARVGSFADLMDGRSTDYSFYYNPVDRQLFTLRKFSNLFINNTSYTQEAINIFNDFDEFGARVSLPRLYLESNSNYKKRILDVTQNMPGVSNEALKRTLRRELDIWRAYGATPDSNYPGATPEILEISDIENSTPYFTDAGQPTDLFRQLVEDLNFKYPSNIGYVKWDEGVWDYAGANGEGVSRIPAVYDQSASPLGVFYQPGVGDFDDALVDIYPPESSNVPFSGNIKISGFKAISTDAIYAPVVINYNWYFNYLATVADYDSSKVQAGVVYEISMPRHGNYSTPSTFYANLNYTNRSDFTVGNRLLSNSPTSPEYTYIPIFDQQGMTLAELEFRDKVFNQRYYNSTRSAKQNSINIAEAASINVIFGRTLTTPGVSPVYANLSVGNYKIDFSRSTPAWKSNPTIGTLMTLTTPNLDRYNAGLYLGSNIYATKQGSFNSDIYKGMIALNTPNTLNVGGVSNALIQIDELVKKTVLKHQKATPQYLYVAPNIINSYPTYGSVSNVQARGGYSTDPITDNTYLVPSVSNIQWQPRNAAGVVSATPAYFDQATINFAATPYYMDIFTKNNTLYPFIRTNYEYFEAETTPNIFYGFIDENNRVFKNDEEYKNSFLLEDKFLETVSLNRNSFGLAAATPYIVDSFKINTTPNYINSFTYSNDAIISDLNTVFNNLSNVDVDIYSEKDEIRQNNYRLGINSGWIYIKEKEQYIYVNPETATYNGRFFELTLPNSPRKGAPIIANVGGKDYRNLVFEDLDIPGGGSFYNTETVLGRKGNSLYLSYQNIKNASVTDVYTGKKLFSNLSSGTNVISPFNQATPSVVDREYEVVYYVNDAFYVDNDVYNSSIDDYESKAYFSTTPSTNSYYYITYENSYKDNFIDSGLNLSQIDSPINEGYIYLTKDEFNFSSISAYLSPAFIADSYDDLMYLSIISYDTNGNLKPGQTFYISGSGISVNSPYLTTNNNGFAKTTIKYTGTIPATSSSGVITISGIGSATPNGSLNSGTQGYSQQLTYQILRGKKFDLKVKAAPLRFTVDTDGISKLAVVGKIYWKDNPLLASVAIKYRKARTLYDLFNTASYSYTQTNSSGYFNIFETINDYSQITDPGAWFVSVEINETVNQIQSKLAALGETVSASNITITGDVTYWNEKYDNIHYANEAAPLPSAFTPATQLNSGLIATPNFVVKHHNSIDVYSTNSVPNWIPPSWVPLNRFQQYQMGLLGSTPNYIVDYGNIRPDSGEE